MSLKEELAAASNAKRKTETTTFLGKEVEVRAMTVGQRSRMMDVGYSKGPKPAPVYARLYPALLIETVYSPTGDPVFAVGDEDLINGLDAEEVDRVANISLRVSGMDPEAARVAAGNSGGASDD